MDIKLTDYIPDYDSISAEKLADVRSRLVTIVERDYPDIDHSPNTVFGDLILTPLAGLIAGWEEAAGCILGDLDLQNVINGDACNCEFIESYLQNFGLENVLDALRFSRVRIDYNTNQQYIIPTSEQFEFNGFLFYPLCGSSGVITVNKVGGVNNNRDTYTLVEREEGVYSVTIPVYGPTTASVDQGDSGQTSLLDEEIIRVVMEDGIEELALPQSVKDRALLAQKTFASQNFANRSGIVSFYTSKLPGIIGVSPVISGDFEMQYDGDNALGVRTPRVDVYLKGYQYPRNLEQSIKVFYSVSDDKWYGALDFLQQPLLIKSVHTGDSQNISSAQTIAKSLSSAHPRLSSVYSSNQKLGVQINGGENWESDVDINSPSDEPGVITDGNAQLTVTGQYHGGPFNSVSSRSVSLEFTGTDVIDGVTYATANATDIQSGTTISGVLFVEDPSDSTLGVLDFENSNSDAYEMFGGLILSIDHDNTSSANFSPGLLTGKTFSFSYNAQWCYLRVTYLSDGTPQIGEQLLSNSEYSPAFPVTHKNFVTVNISSFKVYYRAKHGTYVDIETAKNEIYEYLNSLAYPELYEESAIADILYYAGATGLRRVVHSAKVYPSPAEYFSEDGKNDTYNSYLDSSPQDIVDLTQDLELVTFNSGINRRNVNYLCERSAISVIEEKV